jgi:hypothetical protein
MPKLCSSQRSQSGLFFVWKVAKSSQFASCPRGLCLLEQSEVLWQASAMGPKRRRDDDDDDESRAKKILMDAPPPPDSDDDELGDADEVKPQAAAGLCWCGWVWVGCKHTRSTPNLTSLHVKVMHTTALQTASRFSPHLLAQC